jgi:hypothetical protein
MDYGHCAVKSCNKIITATENNRKLTIHNPFEKVVRKVQVDDCLPIEKGKRCDYLFEIEEPITQVIYLELKGCDIEKAYNQLLATIDLFIFEHKGVKKDCHIVASRVPKAGTKVQQLKIKMLKSKQAQLIVSTDKAFITIENSRENHV